MAYYSHAAFGTDRYPPFTLADVADYPADLDIAYPQRLSRGFVLVKWLLGLPHYIIVGLLAGDSWIGWQSANGQVGWDAGLIGILALVAAVTVAFTGTYPKPLFDLIVGLDRWVLRVAAHAALMTDAYPLFRVDMGGQEPPRCHARPSRRRPNPPRATHE